MRTTVEIRDDLRAKLLDLSARRGEKGFSKIVEEAVESYLRELEESEGRRERALAAGGSLSAQESEELRREAHRIRRSWR